MEQTLQELTKAQLKEYAKVNNIDLGEARTKVDIINTILNNQEGNIKEENAMEENQVLNEEFVSNEEVNTAVPTEVAADKKVWLDSEGNEISMSQFIREQFTKFNKSRKEISETYDINYRTVYGATVNMENDAEPATRGRGVVNPKIQVTADNKVLTSKEVDGAVVYFLNNEEIKGEEIPATNEIDRNTWIKEQVTAGANRGDIAKALDLSYGVVYGLTKDEDGTRQKYEVEVVDPETGAVTSIARSEYIRKRVAEGVSKSDVAKELGVEYSVVWQATKKDKTDAEKLADAIEVVAKFADKVKDVEAFKATLERLKNFEIVTAAEAVEAPVQE